MRRTSLESPEAVSRVARYELLCKLSSWDKSAVSTVRQALAKVPWREIDLATQPKGHRLKITNCSAIAPTNSHEAPMDCGSTEDGERKVYFESAPAVSIVSSAPYLVP